MNRPFCVPLNQIDVYWSAGEHVWMQDELTAIYGVSIRFTKEDQPDGSIIIIWRFL